MVVARFIVMACGSVLEVSAEAILLLLLLLLTIGSMMPLLVWRPR